MTTNRCFKQYAGDKSFGNSGQSNSALEKALGTLGAVQKHGEQEPAASIRHVSQRPARIQASACRSMCTVLLFCAVPILQSSPWVSLRASGQGTGLYHTGPYHTGSYHTGPYHTGPYDTGSYDIASFASSDTLPVQSVEQSSLTDERQPAEVTTDSGVGDDSQKSVDANSLFRPMSSEQALSSVLHWLILAGVDEPAAKTATAFWLDRQAVDVAADELTDLVVETFAAVDPATKRFVAECASGGPVQPPLFDGVRGDPFYQNSVQLFYARWLAQHRYFDESLAILESLNPDSSIDPASLFFYRAVCQQKLLRPTEAADSLVLLLNSTLDVPHRYQVVAEMMQQDLKNTEDGGLPEVARVMSDVQRRLDLGRSGEKVQKQEDQVVALLDKLLEDMQQQQQQQQGGGGSGGGSEQSEGAQGASQSSIKGAAADGEADRKELTENGAWGMLDKQAEIQARELIRQQFPANYLDAISRYTRKIAERK